VAAHTEKQNCDSTKNAKKQPHKQKNEKTPANSLVVYLLLHENCILHKFSYIWEMSLTRRHLLQCTKHTPTKADI